MLQKEQNYSTDEIKQRVYKVENEILHDFNIKSKQIIIKKYIYIIMEKSNVITQLIVNRRS